MKDLRFEGIILPRASKSKASWFHAKPTRGFDVLVLSSRKDLIKIFCFCLSSFYNCCLFFHRVYLVATKGKC